MPRTLVLALICACLAAWHGISFIFSTTGVNKFLDGEMPRIEQDMESMKI
ncbi:hypothetical protein KIPB_005981, partial [Kipferlia bialata]|eukprot:g5981.t1